MSTDEKTNLHLSDVHNPLHFQMSVPKNCRKNCQIYLFYIHGAPWHLPCIDLQNLQPLVQDFVIEQVF